MLVLVDLVDRVPIFAELGLHLVQQQDPTFLDATRRLPLLLGFADVFAGQDEDVGDIVKVRVLQGGSLDSFLHREQQHLLPHFVEAFIVDHAFVDTLHHIGHPQDISGGHFARIGEQIDVLVQDEAAVADNVEGGFTLNGLDSPDEFVLDDVVLPFFDKEVNLSVVDNDDIPLFSDRVIGFDVFVLFVDDPDEFEGHIILEADSEVGQEEDTLFNDPDIGFEYEVLFDCGVNIL